MDCKWRRADWIARGLAQWRGLALLLLEALAAVDRLVPTRLERNLGRLAATCASGRVECTGTTGTRASITATAAIASFIAAGATLFTAGAASARFVGIASGSVPLLIGRGVYELLTAFSTRQHFVFEVHEKVVSWGCPEKIEKGPSATRPDYRVGHS